MDNYQKLFNEVRPLKDNETAFPNANDLDKMIGSEWHNNLLSGVNAYEQKNYKLAISFLDKAIAINSKNPHLYKVRANIKEDSGDARGAILDYKMALYTSGSDWYATYNQIAINYLSLQDFSNALKGFDIAIELKSNLLKKGIDESQMSYVLDGVVRRVDYEKMYTNRANTKLSIKDFQGCADDCAKAVKVNPEYSNSYFIYGLLFLTVDHNENAYKALKMAESRGHRQATTLLQQYFK